MKNYGDRRVLSASADNALLDLLIILHKILSLIHLLLNITLIGLNLSTEAMKEVLDFSYLTIKRYPKSAKKLNSISI